MVPTLTSPQVPSPIEAEKTQCSLSYLFQVSKCPEEKQPQNSGLLSEFLLHFPFLHLLFKTYLAASDLSCGTRELHHVMWDLFTVAGRLHSMWDLTSLTRARTCTPGIARQILNHQATREVPPSPLFYFDLVILYYLLTFDTLKRIFHIISSLF